MSNYREILEDTEAKVLAIINDEEGWEQCQDADNICITRKKSSYCAGNMFKMVVDIDAPYDEVAKAWFPKPKGTRQEWEKAVTSIDCIQDIDEECMIVRTVSPSLAMGLISPREFIDAMMLKFFDDGVTAMLIGIGVEHKDYPIQDELVRAISYPCGAIMRKIEPAKTHMVYVYQTDTGGNLPLSLVEAVLPKSLHTLLDSLRQYVTEG